MTSNPAIQAAIDLTAGAAGNPKENHPLLIYLLQVRSRDGMAKILPLSPKKAYTLTWNESI